MGNDAHTIANLSFAPITKNTITTLYPDLRYFPHIRAGSVSILEKIARNNSIKKLLHYTASIIQGDLNLTINKSEFSTNRTSVSLLRGRNVARFVVTYGDTTEYCKTGFLTHAVEANKSETFLISQQVMNQQAHRRLNFAMTAASSRGFLWGNSVNKIRLKNQAHSKAFLALLNSNFMDWFFRTSSTNNHVQIYELEQLPIPAMTAMHRKQLDDLATEILDAKKADPAADTAGTESEIDRLVYDLFGLTEEEIEAVEGYT